jgi:phosphoribosylanthranilate isomerase
MKVKICGITSLEDAQNAISLGVHALGFIFYSKSPRYITPEKVEEIVMFLPPFVQLVGVFVNEEKEYIEEVARRCRLDIIQLHGSESPSFCLDFSHRIIKAFQISQIEDVNQISPYQGTVSAVLLDTKMPGKFGGTGKTFDWGLALKAKEFHLPVILAGGITLSNIKKAIKLVDPYAVDISTSVEKEPGIKDYNKMKEFLGIAKKF